MWFQDPANGKWWNSHRVVYFSVSGSGTTWNVSFLTVDAGTQTWGTIYATKVLAQAALDVLVATFTF